MGVASLLIVFAVAGLSAQRPVLSTQQILEQLERDWVAALHRNDADFVSSILRPSSFRRTTTAVAAIVRRSCDS